VNRARIYFIFGHFFRLTAALPEWRENCRKPLNSGPGFGALSGSKAAWMLNLHRMGAGKKILPEVGFDVIKPNL
jgi:hypothetical protein